MKIVDIKYFNNHENVLQSHVGDNKMSNIFRKSTNMILQAKEINLLNIINEIKEQVVELVKTFP